MGHEAVVIRELSANDLDQVVSIDQKTTGRSRRAYFERTIEEALALSGSRISLGAELGGQLVGFVLARLYHGEFGVPEPKAIVDAISVAPEYEGRGAGRALIEQLEQLLRSMSIETIQTHVDWTSLDLIGFLARNSFAPAPVLTLEKRLG